MIAVAGSLTISAQLPSLPIGSTNAVLEDAIQQINEVWISVRLLSEDGLSASYIYRQVVPFDSPGKSRADLEALIKRELAIANRDTFAVYGPLYPTRQFLSVYTGIKRLPDPGWNPSRRWYILFGTDNEYSLVQNEKGELVAPKSAYTVDLVAAVMRSYSQPFFIPGIDYALLEVEDETGKVILSDDSRNHRVGGREGDVVVNRDDEVVGITTMLVVSGRRGKVSILYKNGAKRVYRLKDGTLFPQLEIAQKSKGLLLTVLGTDSFVIEFSQDLMNWESSYTLVPLSDSPPRRFLEKNPNGKGFYRLRVTEPAGQRR
ncbi:MAG: hypothetical protein AAB699_00465 [Patescibacteria group bacterium]